jgi:flagellar protein FlbD
LPIALTLVRAAAFLAGQAFFRLNEVTGSILMIRLSQLNGESFILNAELIRYVEARPDTFITLTTGDRIVVREPMDEVMERAVRYQQSKFLIPAPQRSRRGE